jgi:hypothetical protein
MNRVQRKLLVAGAVLIVVVNALALGGVAWNRSGAPDSTLTLTQRELRLPYMWGMERERSGLSLTLQWRMPVSPDNREYDLLQGSTDGTPAWLDAGKLRALGFDLRADDRGRASSREVVLVLELAGPAYKAALERAAQRVERAEKRAERELPDDKQGAQALQAARENLQRERDTFSRLFAIDAGLDAAALRTRYPDRNRHLIVGGRIRPHVTHGDKGVVASGWIESLSVGSISVPESLRGGLDGADRMTGRADGQRFEADIAWGRRLEPWVTALRVLPAGPAGQ